MGYYTGNGVVTGGNSDITTFARYVAWGAAHVILQRTIVSTTRKSGVQLSTATGSTASSSMSDHQFSSGAADAYYAIQAKGSKTTYQYSRIGDSNLYNLDVITTAYAVNKDGGAWQT